MDGPQLEKLSLLCRKTRGQFEKMFFDDREHSTTTWTRRGGGGGSIECPRGPTLPISESILYHCELKLVVKKK